MTDKNYVDDTNHPPRRGDDPWHDDVHVEIATRDDVDRIRDIVIAAYSKYVPRIGRRPAPMDADYDAMVTRGKIHVLKRDQHVLGLIAITPHDDALMVGNLCVAPEAQGKGFGRVLMGHAETMARSMKLAAITLFTNEKMHENIGLYLKLGFVVTGRRTEDGFERVYFRKTLDPAGSVKGRA